MQIKHFFLPVAAFLLIVGIVACTKEGVASESTQSLSENQVDASPTEVGERALISTACGSVRLRVTAISNPNHRFVMSIRNKSDNTDLLDPLSTQNCPIPGGLGFTVNYAIGNDVFFGPRKNSSFIVRLAAVNNINCSPVPNGTVVSFQIQGPSVSPPYSNPIINQTLTFANGSPVAEATFGFTNNCTVTTTE
jgi:hypothetical protein